MTSMLKLSCDSIPDLWFQTLGTANGEATFHLVVGSWTTTETGDGTVIEAFEVFSDSDRVVTRDAIRRLELYAEAAAAAVALPVNERVLLSSRSMDEPNPRTARVVGITWKPVDGEFVDATLYSTYAHFDIAIERAAVWETAGTVVKTWTNQSTMGVALELPAGVLEKSTAPIRMQTLNVTTVGEAAFAELWAGVKNGIGLGVNGMAQFVPTIKVNSSTMRNVTGNGELTFYFSDLTAQDNTAANIRFANVAGTVDKLDYKARFVIDFQKWNASTLTLPQTVWHQYSGSYHLLCRYKTQGPDENDTTTPLFAIGGIHLTASAWELKLPRHYVPNSNSSWRAIDLGVLTLGDKVKRESKYLLAFSNTAMGLAAGLLVKPANYNATTLAALRNDYEIVVDDFSLIPADNFVHVKAGTEVNKVRRLIIEADDSGAPAAFVADRTGTLLGGPPYKILDTSADVESKAWVCPPWPESKLVVRVAKDGQAKTGLINAELTAVPRTRGLSE